MSGHDADWLGATQTSRLRSTLRDLSDVDDLLTRMRDRAHVHTFQAHRAALPRLRKRIISPNLRQLQVTDAMGNSVDGYLDAADLDTVVRTLGLRESGSGNVILRATDFDMDHIRALITTRTVAALDAATSTDPRLRGVGHRALADLLKAYA